MLERLIILCICPWSDYRQAEPSWTNKCSSDQLPTNHKKKQFKSARACPRQKLSNTSNQITRWTYLKNSGQAYTKSIDQKTKTRSYCLNVGEEHATCWPCADRGTI